MGYLTKTKNSVRKIIKKLLWHCSDTEANRKFRIYSRIEFPFKNKEVIIDDLKIKKSMEMFSNFEQYEYIVKLTKKSIIEPDYGWIITGFNNILCDSLPYGTEYLLPSFKKYIKTKLCSKEKIKKEKIVISLRDTSETSYFHFYNDVLNKIVLLDDFKIDENIPIVISKNLSQKTFFKDVLNRSNLKKRAWIIQDNFYIEADEIIYCKNFPHNKAHFEKLLDLLNIPEPDLNTERRIFLTRDPSKGRNLENINEIIGICTKYGFEIVDTEKMSLDEQIKLFSNSRNIVGLHGAGLTNIIFRRGGPLSLLEIFPPDNIPPHYYWLTIIFNYKYDGIVGTYSNSDEEKNFEPLKRPYYLNPDIFIKKLERLEKEKFFTPLK